MRDLTKRVYLLECETGTQEGPDLRVFEKRPGQGMVEDKPTHQDHLDALELYQLRRDNNHLALKNKRQEDTIRKMGSDHKKKEAEFHAEIQGQGKLRMELSDKMVYLKDIIRILKAQRTVGQEDTAGAAHWKDLYYRMLKEVENRNDTIRNMRSATHTGCNHR
jgi:hypothetical protein